MVHFINGIKVGWEFGAESKVDSEEIRKLLKKLQAGKLFSVF
jgi:hypothetical protein